MLSIPADVCAAGLPQPAPARLRALDYIVAVVLVGLALAVRAPFFTEALAHKDEAIVGLMAQDIAEGRRLPIYFYGQGYMGALEAYVVAGFLRITADPILSLRLGPACFFAALTGLQYLMLSRWFGRAGGLAGAAVLLAAAPMFTLWSIAARGAYIEVLVWGTLLWWVYMEYFASWGHPRLDSRGRRWLGQVLAGFLVGSGLWLNPTITVFIAAALLHAMLGRPLLTLAQQARFGPWVGRWQRLGGRWPCAFLAAALGGVVLATTLFSIEVTTQGIQRRILLGVLPYRAGPVVLAVAALFAAAYLLLRTRLLSWIVGHIRSFAPLILATLVGCLPAMFYVLQRRLAGLPLEDALQFGFRPLWSVGETASYLAHGVPLLLGADPAPLLTLLFMGRPPASLPSWAAALLPPLNWVVAVGLAICGGVLLWNYRTLLAAVLRCQPRSYPPLVLVGLGLIVLVGLYLMSGFAFELTSIRYLVPLWSMLPALLAAAVVATRGRMLARVALTCVLLAWGVGQLAMGHAAGAVHTHRALAEALEGRGVSFAVSEVDDAHFVSFLSEQRVRLLEFEPFWARLDHYRILLDEAGPVPYVAQDANQDYSQQWASTGWPGRGPVEIQARLRRRLEQLAAKRPDTVLARCGLVEGYELWTLTGRLEKLEKTTDVGRAILMGAPSTMSE